MAKPEEALNGGTLTWAKLLAFAVLIFGGMFSSAMLKDQVSPPRHDPWTGTQAELQRLMILNEVNSRIDELERDMPPEPTRSRIRAIEQWIDGQDQDYRPPHDKWH